MEPAMKTNLEGRLTTLGIQRILVVDDTDRNIEAAKAYFKGCSSITVDYSSKASEAKMMIEDAYATKKFDLVLSDLQMSNATSGLEVTQCAFTYQAMAAIVTGRNYDAGPDAGHGPNTRLFIGTYECGVPGKKESPEVWHGLVAQAVDYLEHGVNPLLCALKRFHQYVGQPSEDGGKMANSALVSSVCDPR